MLASVTTRVPRFLPPLSLGPQPREVSVSGPGGRVMCLCDPDLRLSQWLAKSMMGSEVIPAGGKLQCPRTKCSLEAQGKSLKDWSEQNAKRG